MWLATYVFFLQCCEQGQHYNRDADSHFSQSPFVKRDWGETKKAGAENAPVFHLPPEVVSCCHPHAFIA